jgi:CRP-like cAMP-binding protein
METKKGEILVNEGKIAKHLYFVLSGYARVFHFEKGIEITNHLASENLFITAYNSFTTKSPAEETVQAISDCALLRISKENLDLLYKQSHNMALFGILMSDRYLVFNNQRAKDLITLTAKEKYLKLLYEEPHILQNVPLQYISSYIGIEPQTLSRIRREISN